MVSPNSIDVGKMAESKKKKKKWIQKATDNAHGQFKAKAEAAGESTKEFAKEKEHAPGVLGKEARLAETLMGESEKKINKKKGHSGKDARKAMYNSKE